MIMLVGITQNTKKNIDNWQINIYKLRMSKIYVIIKYFTDVFWNCHFSSFLSTWFREDIKFTHLTQSMLNMKAILHHTSFWRALWGPLVDSSSVMTSEYQVLLELYMCIKHKVINFLMHTKNMKINKKLCIHHHI